MHCRIPMGYKLRITNQSKQISSIRHACPFMLHCSWEIGLFRNNRELKSREKILDIKILKHFFYRCTRLRIIRDFGTNRKSSGGSEEFGSIGKIRVRSDQNNIKDGECTVKRNLCLSNCKIFLYTLSVNFKQFLE